MNREDLQKEWDPTIQAVTIEWLVAVIRLIGLGIFALIGWHLPPEHKVNLYFLYLFILVGILYNIYVFYLLHTGSVHNKFPHFLSFFLTCDIFLLVALAYFSNIFQAGLLFFYFFLIIIVSLRASFRNSLIIGPFMIAAYFFSSLILSKNVTFDPWRFVLDSMGLFSISAVSGWFAEGRSVAWQMVRRISHHLNTVRQDLDEAQKQLEISRRLQKMQKDFSAIMSHELRTPLTAIIGYSDLMLMGEVGELNDKQKEYISEMMGKSIDLLNLIDNTLNIHRIQTGRWSLHLGSVDSKEIVAKTMSTIMPEALKKNIKINFACDSDENSLNIYADADKVKHVLLNLLSNAVRFSPPGGIVDIKIEVVNDPFLENNFPHLISSPRSLLLSVTDSGPGVPTEDKQNIFEMFYHGKGMNGGSSPGRYGLGLSVAKEIIELHWGKIWYEDAPGGGSKFLFTLPINPLRLNRKIALVKRTFNLEDLLEGLIVQFEEEIRRKNLTITRKGWPRETDEPLMIFADRQLLQCVLFNILNNKIHYAFPGSEIHLSLKPDKKSGQLLIQIINRGEAMKIKIIEQVYSDGIVEDGLSSSDLRHVNVNLSLSRDIIECHGGSFDLQNLPNQEAAVTIKLPLNDKAHRKGVKR